MTYSKLKGVMREHNCSQNELAKKLGITQQSLNAKLNGRSQFTIEETVNILSIFDIKDSNKIVEIFFTHNVPNEQRKQN